jgi:hypothetical protein
MATSLIKPLNNGGTTYIFQSAARDITKTFPTNDNVKFAFSKFALLKLPAIKTPIGGLNNIQFDTVDGAINNATNLSDNGLTFAEHFQNYAFNLESLLLSNSNYNASEKRSVSERVFFKWLKEIGAVRFRSATSLESVVSRFVESDSQQTASPYYDKVVRYIGDIKVLNSVYYQGEAYSEVYINMPSTDGATPFVLFNTISDDNYQPSMILTGDDEYIVGRDSNTVHPMGLTTLAFYDYDDAIAYTDPNAQWMGGTLVSNSYYTEPTSFSDPSNVLILKYRADYGQVGSTVQYYRNKLDGITIDFESTNYTPIVNDPSLNNINDFNRSGSSADFDFNVILLYYDIYDVNNPTDRATNLYGVLFIDNITTSVSDGGVIKVFSKSKYNPITKLNGNSYGLKSVVKFDSTIENAAIETVINDYESYSLNLFSDVLTELKQTSDMFDSVAVTMLQQVDTLKNLENQGFSQTQLDSFNVRLAELEQSFANANMIVSDKQSIMDAIKNLATAVTAILNSTTPVQLNFNYDVIKSAEGIALNILESGKMSIRNKVQKYNSVNSITLSSTFLNQNVISLRHFTNLLIETSGGFTADDDVVILIDDTLIKWETGDI